MDRHQLEAVFDGQALTYDTQWAKLAAFRDGVHLLLASVFSGLPPNSRMLCVGAGTGAEIHHLAERFAGWTFVAVDPSAGMVAAARERAEKHGYAHRCTFHQGYVDTLPNTQAFDCASSLLVSQFILDTNERTKFFASIAKHLKPGGILASSDLAADVGSPSYQDLLEVWMRTMSAAELTPDRLQKMREAYARDVAILPPRSVEALIQAGGFEVPIQFYQAGLIHAFYCRRLPPST
jgi:tRNA (cmo5U34)-methyltransferase